MNELEKRAQAHGKKKDGLSPFCSLSEDSDYYKYITDIKTADNGAEGNEEDMATFVKRVTSGNDLVQYVADRIDIVDDKHYLVGYRSDMKEIRFLLGTPGESSSYYNVRHLLKSPYWHISLSLKDELTELYLSKKVDESKKKKKPFDSINTNAGNVEHNIAMFNKMNSPVEGPCTNPVSGPFGGDVGGGEAMGEAVEKKAPILYVIKDSHGNILSRPNEDDDELWDRVSSMEARGRRGLCVVVCTPDMLKKEELEECLTEAAPKKETVELEYKNLEFTQYGTQRDADDWDEWDRCMDWTYEVDKDDLYTFIFESCIDETDFPEAFEDEFDPNNLEHWARFESWLDDNFDAIYSKYEEKILENWEEDAAEEASDEYDPDDYVDWDSMPGGHDDDRYWEDMDEAVAGIRAGSQESTKVFMDATDDPDNFVAVKVTTEFTTDGDFNSHMFDDGAPVLKYFYRGGTSRVYDVKIPKNSWLVVSPWYGEVFRFNGKGWIMLQDSPSDIQEFTTYVEESDDLDEGEEVFMEKYSYGLNEEYKRDSKMIDYFEQMNSEEDEA